MGLLGLASREGQRRELLVRAYPDNGVKRKRGREGGRGRENMRRYLGAKKRKNYLTNIEKIQKKKGDRWG